MGTRLGSRPQHAAQPLVTEAGKGPAKVKAGHSWETKQSRGRHRIYTQYCVKLSNLVLIISSTGEEYLCCGGEGRHGRANLPERDSDYDLVVGVFQA
eukprot:7548572-Pyramimonas_sp.AAC.1